MITAEQAADLAELMAKLDDAVNQSNFYVYNGGSIEIAIADRKVGELMPTDDGIQFTSC